MRVEKKLKKRMSKNVFSELLKLHKDLIVYSLKRGPNTSLMLFCYFFADDIQVYLHFKDSLQPLQMYL